MRTITRDDVTVIYKVLVDLPRLRHRSGRSVVVRLFPRKLKEYFVTLKECSLRSKKPLRVARDQGESTKLRPTLLRWRLFCHRFVDALDHWIGIQCVKPHEEDAIKLVRPFTPSETKVNPRASMTSPTGTDTWSGSHVKTNMGGG